MIRKLILIRLKDSESGWLQEFPLANLVVGDPASISPLAWAEEAGLSHYGFTLEGLKLKDIKELGKWAQANSGVTVLDLYTFEKGKQKDRSVEDTLKSVGLRINTLAE